MPGRARERTGRGMDGSTAAHWEAVWAAQDPEAVSWYQRDPAVSLSLILEAVPDHDAAIVDVGGGASMLVDRLLDTGYVDVTVLDLSQVALDHSQARLGERAGSVSWVHADVTIHRFDRVFDLWHDRAVLHFLVDPDDRARYREAASAAVRPGGHLVVATFALDGPERCSGLPVVRHGPDELSDLFAGAFEPVGFVGEVHVTPAGVPQPFQYGHFRRR